MSLIPNDLMRPNSRIASTDIAKVFPLTFLFTETYTLLFWTLTLGKKKRHIKLTANILVSGNICVFCLYLVAGQAIHTRILLKISCMDVETGAVPWAAHCVASNSAWAHTRGYTKVPSIQHDVSPKYFTIFFSSLNDEVLSQQWNTQHVWIKHGG